jgi:hypothetical protein
MDRFPRIFERGRGSGPAADHHIGEALWPWGELIRALAGDPTRYLALARCSLQEALLAYQDRLRQSARHDYEVAMLVWAILHVGGAVKKDAMPELPEILKD